MRRHVLTWACCLLAPSLVLAASTQHFEVQSHEAFADGKLDGTAAWDTGKVTPGIKTTRVAVEDAAVSYCAVRGPDGALYVGTGTDGAIYRVEGEEVALFAKTGAAVVTSLAWVGSSLHAGTLPGGKVFPVSPRGEVGAPIVLAGAEHVWALAYDGRRRLLHAATGPEGKLFTINEAGKAKVSHDDEAEHLLSATLDPEGKLYVGTSDGARLLEIAAGKAQVVHDFDGDELTAVAYGEGLIAVAANSFDDPPNLSSDPAKRSAARMKRPKPGRGKLYAVHPDGRVDPLLSSEDAHITAVEVAPEGKAVFAGLAENGRVLRAALNGSHAVWADVDERQISALGLSGGVPYFVTSDGVASYGLSPARGEALWTSAVLDAKFPARFGALSFRSRGQLRFRTRSGNTETPDDSWSEWSRPIGQRSSIRSPGARFLQLRAMLEPGAELYGVHAYYLPQNQATRVTHVRVERAKASDKKEASGDKPVKPSDGKLKLTWDVDNPDDDRLRFRIFYRGDAQATFLPMLREHEELHESRYAWNTVSIPDGYYRVRVQASDERDNPPPYSREHAAVSAPLLVDNHAPNVPELSRSGTKLRGRVQDTVGPISALALAIDGSPYAPFYPVDDLLDSPEEKFEVEIGSLSPGTHIASVKATDAAGNVVVRALEFVVGR